MIRRLLLFAAFVVAPAYADPVWPVRPEPSLACMTSVIKAPILDHPKADAHPIAFAGSIVFAVQPSRGENGFIEVERPNKQEGWIEQSALTPGQNTCVPTLMSNGLILIGGGP